ncbi:lipase family protein [Nocardia brasiliensis]|uniref:lipase family protein n=1 Tax=Nocardia brasiliensis TaxID=37326 RepID=UPI003D89F121
MLGIRTTLAAAAISLLLGSATAAAAAPYEGPVQPGPPLGIPAIPEFDPFYRPPAEDIVSRQPGEIIAARAVTVANFSLLPVNVDAWQVSYRSNNSYDQPIAAVATVLKPRGTVAPGTRNLLSYQVAENATGQYCASSYQLQQWSIPGMITGQSVTGPAFLEAQVALQQGWAVAIPDHEGPDAAFGHGPLGGRITLDGIRAAENFAPLGLDTTTKVGLMGYSAGSIPTMHAAEMAPNYAPELNIVGVASGGTDADLGALVNLGNNNATAGVVLAGIIGLAHEEPEFRTFLRTKGTPLAQTLLDAKDRLCVNYQAATFPFLNIKGLIDVPGDPLQAPEAAYVLDRTRMGKVTPTMPVYLYQANMDWVAPVGPVNTLVDTYCRDPRAQITYTRDHFSEHLTLEAAAVPSVMLWLRDRFAGVPAEPGCTTNDVGSIALDQRTWPIWADIVGDTIAGVFGGPIGN